MNNQSACLPHQGKIITTVLFFIVVTAASGPGQITKANTKTKSVSISGIEWRMHPKFTPPTTFGRETNLVEGYFRQQHKYDPEYIKAREYGITIKIKVTSKTGSPIKYKWEIIGLHKRNGTTNPYKKTYTTTREGLFSESTTSSQSDINPQYENIEVLPYDGTYKIRITPIVISTKIEQPQNTFETIIHLKDFLVAAIGDSFASGEGNPDVDGETDDPILCDQIKIGVLKNEAAGIFGFNDEFRMKKEAVWLEPEAHRSFFSPAAQLARKLEDNDPHSVITFINFGTSGAKILDGLLRPQHSSWQSTGQVQEVKSALGDRKVDALLMSIGINDIGTSGGGISSLIQGAASPGIENYFDAIIIDEVNTRLDRLDNSYALLNNEIKQILDPSNIFLFEVPVNMFRNADNEVREGCGALAFITRSEANQLDRFGRKLQEKMINACNLHKWRYIGGVVAAFKGHGYCESRSQSWYRAASTSCKIQGDINGTIHPNTTGHAKIAELAYPIVAEALSKQKMTAVSSNNTN